MTDMTDEKDAAGLRARLQDEMADSIDEERELEMDDDRLARLLDDLGDSPPPESVERHHYFKELLRLQRELIKLQDWVVHKKLKVVVLFEGRDAAGKGGVIKRVTQRLNPRVCRDGGAAGADRARAQPMVFPALRRPSAGGRRDRAVRPQLVQPRRRRTGDGILHRDRMSRSSSAPCPSSSACWCARASS